MSEELDMGIPDQINDLGFLCWHGQEEGSYDCGVSLGLGGKNCLFVGELSNQTCEEHGLEKNHFGIVLYRNDKPSIYLGSTSEKIDTTEVLDFVTEIEMAIITAKS